jgi:sortase A
MTVVAALIALVLVAGIAVAQRRAWVTHKRASRRAQLVEALMASPGLERASAPPSSQQRWVAFPEPSWFGASSAAGAPAGALPHRAALPTASMAPVDRLARWLRSRRWARRGLTVAAVVMALAAVGIIGYPFFSNLYTNRLQHHLRQELTSPELRQAYLDHNVPIGDSLTRIEIPKINVDTVVVEGTTADALRAGAGHYAETPLPCVTGNVGIAGHRTTYGRPFHDLNQLAVGDTITLVTPVGQCTYKVNKAPFSVLPSDVAVLDPTPDATLTLTTCDPPGSAARRLIVQATLVSGQVAATGGPADQTPTSLQGPD